MTIAYYVNVPFPNNGMATGHRIRHLTQALSGAGVRCCVLTPFSDNLKTETLTVGNVEYHSLCSASGRWSKRVAFYVQFPVRAFSFLRQLKKSDPNLIIYSYTSVQIQMWWAILFAKLLHCPICREGTELPYSVINHAPKFKQFFEVNLALKLYDGFVSITHALFDYYTTKGRKSCKHVYIPMTVDCNRFDCTTKERMLDFEYVAYTGTMLREGGGVDILVQAFNLLAKSNPNLHLVLIGGDGTKNVRQKLSALAAQDVLPRIHFMFGGAVTNDEMAAYIKQAKILAMLPQHSKMQEGCFPTKLGEYLASGVPAVVSRVGIPPQYLTDGENIRFVPPNDPTTTAAVMFDILENYNAALKIAARGKEYARTTFHYQNFGPQLAEWFKSVETKQ